MKRGGFYLRGRTWLGLLNTILAPICGYVLVRHTDEEGHTIRWSWASADRFPPAALVLAMLLLGAPTLAADPKPDCSARPAWCQPGFVCIPTACAAESAAQLELLAADLAVLKTKRARRWNCTLGPGAGVLLQSDAGKITFDAAPIVGGLVCGWTF